MSKEDEIMAFLEAKVFGPVKESPTASRSLKSGVAITRTRMSQMTADGMIRYFWSALFGTERSVGFAKKMQDEGFDRFEEVVDDFRIRFHADEVTRQANKPYGRRRN